MNRKIIFNNKALICVPAIAKTSEELKKELLILDNCPCDIIEWRADFFQDDILSELKKVRNLIKNKKLLFTFRTLAQGGNRDCETYKKLVTDVINTKLVDFIDIEIISADCEIINLAKEKQILSIVSSHYFTHTPKKDDIKAEFARMEAIGADIPKIAVMPKKLTDVTGFMEAVYETSQINSPIIGISMSKLGLATRLCPEQIGSCLSFAAGVSASAPGQIDSETLHKIIYS